MIPYGKQPVHYPCADIGAILSVTTSPLLHSVPGTECLIVEGDSAAKSVDQVRNRRRQAILALQGKPLNAVKAGDRAVSDNEIFQRIFETLLGYRLRGTGVTGRLRQELHSPQRCVYGNIVLLMDPDADGIHCGVLMMAFFRRFADQLIQAARIHVVRPPMFVFRLPAEMEVQPSQWPVASSPEHADAIEQTLRDHGINRFEKTRHRGLGSLDSSLLGHTSVDPATRRQNTLTIQEVDAALTLFGG